MKSKKKVSFHDDNDHKVKQPSRMKKKHLLKKESTKNVKYGNKRVGKPGGVFKKNQRKQFGDDESGLSKPGWKKSGKKSKFKKSLSGKTNLKHLKTKKRTFQENTVVSDHEESSTATTKGKKRKSSEVEPEVNTQEKPQATKRLKLFQMPRKERRRIRKEQKNTKQVFSMSMAAKKIWEVVRRDDCDSDKKKNLISELLNLIKGNIKQLIFAHDTVRVIECIVAAGNAEQRNLLFNEVKDDIIALAKSKYAKFFLIKMLNYGTKEQKDIIIRSFKGQVLSLVRHSEAASVIETAYNDYANARQRAEIVQEFYGPTFMVFKDENAKNLDDILFKYPEQKVNILNHIKEVLLKVTEKSVIRHSIIHYVLREFITHADPQSRSELIENICDAVVEILHTKDGARVAMNCLWHGTVKDRKKIIKSMKMHVAKIAKEEHGSLALIAIFDCLDDIKLVEQIIINKLCEHFLELADDVHARKVLLYLLCPRDRHFFHPDVVNILKAGDNNEHSKKSSEVRWNELRHAASPLFLKLASEHVNVLVKTNATSLLLLGILQHSVGNKKKALENVSSLLHSPYQVMTGNELHPLEQPSLHFLIKKLLQKDLTKLTTPITKDDNEESFFEILATSIPTDVMKTWIECNRGAFILLDLLKSGIPSVVSRITEEMTGLHGTLKAKNYKGAELLLSELKKCSN